MNNRNNMLAAGAIGRTIFAPANSKTYLPDILDLKGKVIKYIDCMNGLVDEDKHGIQITGGYMTDTYLNLMKADTKEIFIKDEPLVNFQLSERRGIRDNILKVVDFPNSYIENPSNNDVFLFLVFWYDDFNLANIYSDTDLTNIDSFEVTQFNSTQNKMLFDENRTMYNKEIQDFYTILDNFTTPKNMQSVAPSDMICSYLTLVKNNFEFVQNVPLSLFSNMYIYDRIKLQNIVFDFTNSFIEISPNAAANVAGRSYFFNVEYKAE